MKKVDVTRNSARISAVAACGLGLAACATSLPSFDFFASKPATAALTIESDPPGADARLSVGGTCRTPCTQTVAATNEFTVSYSLNGYAPQTISVRPASDTASGAAPFDPNPVFAQLQPVAPPPKAPPKKKKRPRPPAAAAAAPSEADQGQSLAPAPPGGFAPPTGTFTPTR